MALGNRQTSSRNTEQDFTLEKKRKLTDISGTKRRRERHAKAVLLAAGLKWPLNDWKKHGLFPSHHSTFADGFALVHA